VTLTPEQNAKVNELLNKRIKELTEGFNQVPKMPEKEIQRAGREWKSNLEWKASGYSNGITEKEYEVRKQVQAAAARFYRNRQSLNLKTFTGEVKGFKVDFGAESIQDAESIIKSIE
jgi:hypothetical protein